MTDVNGSTAQLSVGELFAGIGGSAIGLERAGFRLAWYSEIEPYASAVMRKHWPEAPNHGDICAMRAGPVERVDVIAGGFPCQDISNAGKRAGLAGERSGLWWEFHRLIDEIKPLYAVIENVSALRNRGLDVVLGSLAEIGYDAEWNCIPASAVGAPHRRDRIWIVAYPNSDGERQSQRSERDSDETRPGVEASLGHDAGGFRADVADADGPRLEGWIREELRQCTAERASWASGASVPDPDSVTGLEWGFGDASEGAGGRDADRAHLARSPAAFWQFEPNVGRVANGIPSRVDRLRCLGNASLPQISEILGRAIARDHAARTSLQRDAGLHV